MSFICRACNNQRSGSSTDPDERCTSCVENMVPAKIADHPWRAAKQHRIWTKLLLGVDNEEVIILDAHGNQLRWSWPHAHLMAAAPELLAALKESIALNDTLDPRTETRYKEIIAKAEGKKV